MQSKLRVIGLTGNSGSGKTMIAYLLTQQGAYVIDADEISREVMQPKHLCYEEVVAFFGSSILQKDQTIDRKKLGSIVFSDDTLLKTLTNITHRYIIQSMIDKINEIQSDSKAYTCIVLDAPLLVGTSLQTVIDELWVVYADRAILIERIMQRDHLSYADAVARLSKQMEFSELKKYATVLIKNQNQSVEQIQEIVQRNLQNSTKKTIF